MNLFAVHDVRFAVVHLPSIKYVNSHICFVTELNNKIFSEQHTGNHFSLIFRFFSLIFLLSNKSESVCVCVVRSLIYFLHNELMAATDLIYSRA